MSNGAACTWPRCVRAGRRSPLSAAVTAVALLLAGCSAPGVAAAGANAHMSRASSTSAGAASVAAPPPSSFSAAPVAIPSPGVRDSAMLRRGLAAIDPSLADSKAVTRARNVCQKLTPGQNSTTDGLARYVQQEFQDGDTPSVSNATARAIIDVVRFSRWCRS